MGKTKDTRRLADNQAMAVCNSIRSSSRKLNLVAQTIRGLSAEKAVAELSFSKKRIAKVALEVLKSAIANAENNHKLNIDKLVVAACTRSRQRRKGFEAFLEADHRRCRTWGVS